MKASKVLYLTIFFLIILIFSILIIYSVRINRDTVSISDEIKFKDEYESLNSVKNDDGSNKYVPINILENNKIKYSNFEEVYNIIKNGTGVIFFGFPECPWCRRTLNTFLNATSKYDIDNIYYFNALEIRDKKHLDEDGNVIVDKEGTKEYYKLIEALYSFLGEYDGLNDITLKRLYFPTYLFIKDGNVIGIQIGSVASYTSTKEEMNEEQKEELENIFENYLDKIYTKKEICDDKTPVC